MTLRRVPGFPNYQAEDKGFQQISLGPDMARYMQGVADDIAGDANAVGESQYDGGITTVRMGWQNEPRISAEITETKPHWRDARDAILLRVLAAKERNDGR